MSESEEEETRVDDSLTQNIRDQFLCCKICLDRLKEPKTLPCLHTYCAECIHYYIETNHVDARKFACPICRRQIYIPRNGVDGFPDSFFVASLADMVHQRGQVRHCGICKFRSERVTAEAMCVDCKMELCESCSAAHTSAKVTEGHTLIPITQRQQIDHYCRVHRGETIKYYCETCNAPICMPCTFLDHRGHQVEEIKNVRDTFASDMSGLVIQSKDNILQLTHTKADLVELENELFIRKEAVKTDIRRAVQAVLRKLNEQEALLMNELDAIYDVVTVSRDRQKIDRFKFRLERAHDFAEQLLSTDTSPIAQLVNRAEAKENLTQALDYQLPDVQHHTDRLQTYCHFLPGQLHINLGSLLTSTGSRSNSVSSVRNIMPSTRAVYLTTLRTPEEGQCFGEVIAMTFLPCGDLVTLTQASKKVKVFGIKGDVKFEFGEDTELQHPSDMVVTKDGSLAITDCGDMKVKVFDVFGSLTLSFGDSVVFQLPIAIAIDTIHRFLVCDQVKQRVTIHRECGELLQSVEISEISMPQELVCYGNKVYIADCENKIITFYNYGPNGFEFLFKLTTLDNDGSAETSVTCETPGSANYSTDLRPQQNMANTSISILDCSSICSDYYGNLLITDVLMDRIHMLNQKGEMSHVIPHGKPSPRPVCCAASPDGILAVAHSGLESLENNANTRTYVSLYRMVPADV